MPVKKKVDIYSQHDAETATCPDFKKHTDQPRGYIDWHAWAERKMKTHRQIRCKGCGLLSIWVPKKKKPKKKKA